MNNCLKWRILFKLFSVTILRYNICSSLLLPCVREVDTAAFHLVDLINHWLSEKMCALQKGLPR